MGGGKGMMVLYECTRDSSIYNIYADAFNADADSTGPRPVLLEIDPGRRLETDSTNPQASIYNIQSRIYSDFPYSKTKTRPNPNPNPKLKPKPGNNKRRGKGSVTVHAQE